MQWTTNRGDDDDRRAQLDRARSEDERIRDLDRRRDREIHAQETRRDRDAAADRDTDRYYW